MSQAGQGPSSVVAQPVVTFGRDPAAYRHWQVAFDDNVATVSLAVDPDAGLRPGYELKSNSYDLGVDIELHDLVERLRFEHPEVQVVLLTSQQDKLFCAGANIQMLAGSTHSHKVNFCKFTNETRNGIEDATANSQQIWIAALNGTAAGGGYEMALACDEIILVDDRASTVSLPEVPLLGVLPGTGGLTRVVDKRHVRRDRADVFSTKAEGMKGKQALEWNLIDSTAPPSSFAAHVMARATERAAGSDRPTDEPGIALPSLNIAITEDGMQGRHVLVEYQRDVGAATLVIVAPTAAEAANPTEAKAAGADLWLLAAARELDAVILHLRFNEPELGTWIFKTEGDSVAVVAAEQLLADHPNDWFVREVRLLWARVLRRIDVSARTLIALVEPGSCFAGTLAELLWAADRTLMLDGEFQDDPEAPVGEAAIQLTTANEGWYRMSNGLTRLESRFWGCDNDLAAVLTEERQPLLAAEAMRLGLVTDNPDDIDWADEVRLLVEERNSFSPDALTGLEANLRFVGPETMESKIFARLTAWQNWIFQRPNASGASGALQRYGSGSRPEYDRQRV